MVGVEVSVGIDFKVNFKIVELKVMLVLMTKVNCSVEGNVGVEVNVGVD